MIEPQELSNEVFASKYAKGEETTRGEVFHRVARALGEGETESRIGQYREAMEAGVIPAGRIMSAAGAAGIEATLVNCFVQGVADSVSEHDPGTGKPSIYQALAQAAETMRRGGGVGYDFSRIRPKGAWVKKTNSKASGPLSYMRVFDQSCETVESAGARRGAQMGVLRIDHPDIEAFIDAKTQGGFSNFNLSVGVLDAFMEALETGEPFELVHKSEPGPDFPDAYRREDGAWVYRLVDPQAIWDRIMENTYAGAEPGVLFIDRMNSENNLWYAERIEATNPCGEQPLPDNGCCCLGSVNLTRFIREPFTEEATFDFEALEQAVGVLVDMLDKTLDRTFWPHETQRREAMNKRRIGAGITGLGDALVMLGLRYNSPEGRAMAEAIMHGMAVAAYETSVDLAIEKGAFPLFDADKYCESAFIQRLPPRTRERIRQHGVRNSHLISIAPTGTISLAFGDNCSNGIEPAFSWTYTRKVRQEDGTLRESQVEDYAYRLYRALGGDIDDLPEEFVTALEIDAEDHKAMVEAVAPWVDSSISKTVNVPVDYPYESFKSLYSGAFQAGLKGITTYRPNEIIGSVLSVPESKGDDRESPEPAVLEDLEQTVLEDLEQHDPERRVELTEIPEPVLSSVRFPSRPNVPEAPSMNYWVKDGHAGVAFGVSVSHVENGTNHPFETWVLGHEAPRGLAPVAKLLSADMRSNDRVWLRHKLDSLAKVKGQPITLQAPTGQAVPVSSPVAGLAELVRYRCEQLGALDDAGKTPLMDALMSRKEPKAGARGTMSWTVDIRNPDTGDDFAMFVKQMRLPNGEIRPYSVWLSGDYPLAFDGLSKVLSLDMRVLDVAWIGAKLVDLVNWQEPQGGLFAWMPDGSKQKRYPSTEAYMADLLLHHYVELGLLDASGNPTNPIGVVAAETPESHADEGNVVPLRSVGAAQAVVPGAQCPECGHWAVIPQDGCDFCTACGHLGHCG